MKYIRIIEDVLQIELTEKNLINYHINPFQLQELHFSLTDYYKSFSLPEKDNQTLRPYLSPRYEFGEIASLGYAFRKFDLNNPGYILEKSVKKTLLYSHEVCVQDPLTYLLDFFSTDPENEYGKQRIPVISHIFKELARMTPLMKHGLLHIVSDEVFPGLSDYKLVEQNREIERAMKEKIGVEGFNGHDFRLLLQSFYEQFVLSENIDLYFPNEKFKELFKVFLDVNQENYTSKKLETPANFGVLGGLQEINTEKINVNDIISIRQNERVFEDWRLLLSETFKEMNHNKGNYTNSTNEFNNIINEQTRKFDTDILKKARESAFFGNLPKTSEKVFAGFASNILLNLSMPSGLIPSEAGFINTMLTSFLELMNNLRTDQGSRTLKNSLYNHFLSIK